MCVAAITLETMEEALRAFADHQVEATVTQIAASRTKALGSRHMLTAQNPIFLISGNCHE